MPDAPAHIPVLQTTVLETLSPVSGESVLDVTLGLGGHAGKFLENIAPTGTLTGLDADADNLAIAKDRLKDFQDRTTLLHVNFSQIANLNLQPFDIIFADLGLSSVHVDDPSRGFSFRFDGPLDLRFDRTSGKTASDLLQSLDADDLTEVFRTYGELYPEAKKLGRMLAGKQWETTSAFKAEIERGFGYHAKHILPQVFQALRIAVNDELRALAQLLLIGPQLLAEGGRMGIISFHSLEDRMVKQTFRALTTPEKDPITGKVSNIAPYELLTPKALIPSDQEIADNPRSRSAKFRSIKKQSPSPSPRLPAVARAKAGGRG